jgi:hypothetical protein
MSQEINFLARVAVQSRVGMHIDFSLNNKSALLFQGGLGGIFSRKSKPFKQSLSSTLAICREITTEPQKKRRSLLESNSNAQAERSRGLD